MKNRVMVLVVISLVLLSFAFGYLISGTEIPNLKDKEVTSANIPVWQKGMYWVYAFSTPDVDNAIAKIVVADLKDPDYYLGVDNKLDAQRHTVLNYNPMLGRITIKELGIYEGGIIQNVLHFPIKKGNSWKFTLLGREGFEATVVSVETVDYPNEGKTVFATIEAKTSAGEVLKYTYDSEARWFRSMVLKDGSGDVQLRMTLISYGEDFNGTAYFIRGVDLFDKEYNSSRGSPAIDLYDTFVDTGHPKWGPFTSIIYYYDIQTGSQSHALFSLRDHSTTTVVRKTFESNTGESGLGSVASNAGEWGVVVTLQGECHLRIRIAGGIEYQWTV